jgi:hypothetical protein
VKTRYINFQVIPKLFRLFGITSYEVMIMWNKRIMNSYLEERQVISLSVTESSGIDTRRSGDCL